MKPVSWTLLAVSIFIGLALVHATEVTQYARDIASLQDAFATQKALLETVTYERDLLLKQPIVTRIEYQYLPCKEDVGNVTPVFPRSSQTTWRKP